MVNFLTTLVEKGLSYSSVATAKSAICTVLSLDCSTSLGSHPMLQRFMRGVFHANPPAHRFTKVWDVGQVITYLKGLGDNAVLPLKNLTMKLVALIAILSASRVNYLASLSVDAMDLTDEVCVFYPTKLLKHSRLGYRDNPIRLTAFAPDRRLCVLHTLKEYLVRRSRLTTDPSLFISYRQPHKPVHKDTIARWLKAVLLLAGVDDGVFSAHSYRSASTSKASLADVPISDILRQGQWASERTWIGHYRRELLPTTNAFADAMLDN